MDIAIGSNLLRNTNGIFMAQTHDLVQLDRKKEDGTLYLSIEIFTPTGTQAGKLERNEWVTNNQDRFELKIEPTSVTLTDKILKGVVIQADSNDDGIVTIPQAKFYLPDGKLSEVTSESWQIGNKIELKGADVDLHGGPIEIES